MEDKLQGKFQFESNLVFEIVYHEFRFFFRIIMNECFNKKISYVIEAIYIRRRLAEYVSLCLIGVHTQMYKKKKHSGS